MINWFEVALFVLVGLVVLFFYIMYRVGKDLHRRVENALEDATTEEQEIIRKQVVRAMFPPRFKKD